VSIGLPVYNGARHLAETLDSLLAQDFDDFELIISDNASTDETGTICRDYLGRDARIRYCRNDHNLGAAGNYNRTFALARARYFKWAPHDDLYAPAYLRRCVETLDAAHPGVVLCYPQTRLINGHGQVHSEHEDDLDIREPTPSGRLARLLDNAASWCHPVVGLIRTDSLRTTGLIGRHAGADHVLLAELALRGEFHEIPEPLFFRRVHEGGSPSLQANGSPEELAAWFDPRNQERIALPRTRMLIEHLHAVRRAPISTREKLRCCRVLREAPFAMHWSRAVIAGELWRAVRKGLWDRNLLAALRSPQYRYLPHRLWALLSGLKRRDTGRIALAFAPPSRATRDALLLFVADCLSRRSDRPSRDVLSLWLQWPGEPERKAAAIALRGRGPEALVEDAQPGSGGSQAGRSA
jgi:glycosyltransferase involved in cell wall biosynthesis